MAPSRAIAKGDLSCHRVPEKVPGLSSPHHLSAWDEDASEPIEATDLMNRKDHTLSVFYLEVTRELIG